MPTRFDIQQRIAQRITSSDPVLGQIVAYLEQQCWQGRLSSGKVMKLCQAFELSVIELALKCVELAACYALTPVSHFNVGAVAIGQSGTFYFGANLEFSTTAMSQTVHAEQSAISHAWIAGEKGITDIVVNYTPCGHCRQFMNEMKGANKLQIHLPHSRNNLLHSYLPDAFGPKDLGIQKVLFDDQDLEIVREGDPLQKAAILAMNLSYAPYSKAFSGVALQTESRIIYGRYAENAAFNPSFLPLQSAFNFYRLNGLIDKIERVVLCEKVAVLSHRKMTEELAKVLWGLEVEYLRIE